MNRCILIKNENNTENWWTRYTTHFALCFSGEARLGGPVVCHFCVVWIRREKKKKKWKINRIKRDGSATFHNVTEFDGGAARRQTYVTDWSKITTDSNVGGGCGVRTGLFCTVLLRSPPAEPYRRVGGDDRDTTQCTHSSAHHTARVLSITIILYYYYLLLLPI